MKNKADLYRLIKSMTRAEKRFFKLYSALTDGDKNYLKLWEAIEKMDVYNEDALKAKLAGEKFIKHLSYEKNYLYKQVLKTLRIFHEESDVENTIKSRLAEINILFEKGLTNQCLDLIEKTRELAEKHHKLEALSELIRWEELVLDREFDPEVMKTFYKARYQRSKTIIEQLSNNLDYQQLFDEFRLFVKKRQSPVVPAEIEKIMQNPLLQDKKHAKAMRARHYFHQIWSSYYMFKGELEKSAEELEAILTIFEQNIDYVAQDPKGWFGTLNNLCGRYLTLRDKEKFFSTLKRSRSLPAQVTANKQAYYAMRTQLNSAQLELEFYLRTGDLLHGLARKEELQADLDRLTIPLPHENFLTFVWTGASLLFHAGMYKPCIREVNKIILGDEVGSLRVDVQILARILKTLSFYELRDRRGIKVAKQELERCINHFQYELQTLTLLLGFLDQAARIQKEDSLQALEVQLKTQLTDLLATSDADQRFAMAFDLLNWLEQKS